MFWKHNSNVVFVGIKVKLKLLETMYWVKTFLICILLHFKSTSSKELDSDVLPNKTVCGRQPHDRIFGGEETDLTEFPWMVLLEYDVPNENKFYCGGSIISKRHVLTAAHCINDKLVSVRLGEHNLKTDPDCEDTTPGLEYCSDAPKNIRIEKKIVFEKYNSTDINHYGDIALLKLKEEVNFTDFIKPICLPLSEEIKIKSYTGSNLTVAGWGSTENSSYSDIKLKVELPVISEAGCSEYYKKQNVNLLGSQLCAGGQDGKDSCSGDSGGPLMYLHRTPQEENWYVIGVVSFGPIDCGTTNWPGVYTRVPHYMEWLLSSLKL